MLRLTMLGALMSVTVLACPAVAADSFPTRPVTMIVPFAAGGPTDALARILAQAMTAPLGQQIVIENVPGAGGSIGTTRLIRAPADGYTILIHDLALPAGPLLNKNLTYDIRRDLVPIGVINAGPMVLISRTGLAPNTAALFELIRKNPEKISLGHSGIGSNSHMCGLLLQQALGVRVIEVPYRGAGPAMNDMLGGQLDIMCEQSTTAISQIQSHKIVPHGVTSLTRLDALKDVPTLAENGIKEFNFTVWHGLYAPAKTAVEVLSVLNVALQKGLDDAVAKERFATAGRTEFPVEQRSAAQHRVLLDAEEKRLKTALEVVGVKPN